MLTLLHRFKGDEALMTAYRHGDTSAFECLYLRHKDALFTFLHRCYPQTAVTEEVAQETWEAVIRSAERYEPTARFRTWLFQIARRRLADHWRRRDSHHEPLPVDYEQTAAAAENALSNSESHIMQMIGTLPVEQRDVLLLREQGFNTADIAMITGAAAETVKSRLRYARRELRRQLGEES